MSKPTAVQWLIKELKDLGYYTYNLEKLCEQAKQMEKEQQESEQIELINWLRDSLKAKEFYITYEAEELLEKFKTKNYDTKRKSRSISRKI